MKKWLGSMAAISMLACADAPDTGTGGDASSASSQPNPSSATGGPSSTANGSSTTTTATSTGSETSSSSSGSGGAPPLACSTAGTETCANKIDDDGNGTECAQWNRVYGDHQQQSPARPAVSSTGNVYLAGSLGESGSIVFDGVTYSDSPNHHTFLAKLGPDGEEEWIKLLPVVTAVASLPAGGVMIASEMEAPFDFGGGTALPFPEPNTLALAAYDADGNHLWSRTMPADGFAYFSAIAIDANGKADLVGTFEGSIDTGTDQLVTSGVDALMLVQVDAANGNTQWSKSFSDDAGYLPQVYVAVANDQTISIAGPYPGGNIDFGGATPVSQFGPGGPSFLARFDAAGNHLASMTYCKNCQVLGIAADASGGSILTGVFQDTSIFDPAQLAIASTGGLDVFLGKVASDQSYTYTRLIGGTGDDFIYDIGTTCGGDLLTTLDLVGTVTLGPDTINGGGGTMAIVKFDDDGDVLWHREVPNGGECKIGGQSDGEAALACTFLGSADYGAGPLQGVGSGSGEADISIVKIAP